VAEPADIGADDVAREEGSRCASACAHIASCAASPGRDLGTVEAKHWRRCSGAPVIARPTDVGMLTTTKAINFRKGIGRPDRARAASSGLPSVP